MNFKQGVIHKLYRKLLTLYPRTFYELLGESMEQTFHDLWNEKQQMRKELFRFVLWTFLETSMGIFREHLMLISPGVIMQAILKSTRSSVLISFLLILPLIIMEVVNRRNLNEEFPFVLFFVLWLNLFAISLILLPILRGWRTRNSDMPNPGSAQKDTLITNPRSAAILSVVLFLSPGILLLLNSVGWLSLDRLFNGPNPEVMYLPGMFTSLALISLPIAAGIVAGGPIVNTLRSGGGLFAHPIHLVIVVLISSLFAAGLIGLVVDQWPCFMGVPNCD